MVDETAARDPRVFLAIERTFLAWTRTALALMGFGFIVARLGLFLRELAVTQSGRALTERLPPQSDFSGSLLLGCALIAMGIATQSVAMLEHRRRVERFRAAQPIFPMRDAFAISVGMCVLAGGIAIVFYLIAQSTN